LAKFLLIDLEVWKQTTGGKQNESLCSLND